MNSRVPWRTFGVRRSLLFVLATALLAPTPGDVGGCGQPVEDLDAVAFFEAKRVTDCTACRECGFETEHCEQACAEPVTDAVFPETCFPLVHDGKVCLRALVHSTCDEYEPFVSDQAPATPTECDFCPNQGRPR